MGAHSNSGGRNDDDDLVELDKRNALLYNALMKEERSNLVELYCRRREHYPDGPLHVLTIHGDTVLHMAAHTVNAYLVIQLLEMLAEDEYPKLTHQNAVGNTILHEAAAYNKLVTAARRLLEKAPGLLSMHNKFGETALFSAARCGQIEMFAFLHIKVQQLLGDQNIKIREAAERKTFYQKHNDATVLHTAVISGHFDLALTIAKQCEYLVAQRDEHGMTALQHLACNSAVFEIRKMGFLKRFYYHYAQVCRVPLWEAIRKEMVKYESAKKLASFLVAKDNTSWKQTYHPLQATPSETKNNGGPSISSSSSGSNISVKKSNNTETPLFLAIKAGCVDIVEMILQLYPQAVEHVDGNEATILHVAVKYRQLWVFNVLHQVGISWRRLIVRKDRDLNTILHMVGQDCTFEPVQGNPILQLQSELLLFEHVKEICLSCSEDLSLHRNCEGETAKEVFVKNKEHLRTKAVKQVRFRIETVAWLGLFIASVAFSALYTLPGGLDGKTGVPNFLNQPFFLIFIIADALCLTCTGISLLFFSLALVSWFRFEDFKLTVPLSIAAGTAFILLAVSMLALAFTSTIVLIVQEREPHWPRIGLFTIEFLPFIILSLLFMHAYLIIARLLFMSNIYITGFTGPGYSGFSFRSCVEHLFCYHKFITPPPSNPTTVEETTPSVV